MVVSPVMLVLGNIVPSVSGNSEGAAVTLKARMSCDRTAVMYIRILKICLRWSRIDSSKMQH